MEKKKIKVYNIQKYVEEIGVDEQKYTTLYNHKIAIIEGKTGVIVINDEGCGCRYDSLDSEYKIALVLFEKKGSYFHTDKDYTMTLKQIVDTTPCKQMLITEFISNWNKSFRIKENLNDVLDFMKKIGVKSNEYCTKKYIIENS